MAGRVASLLVLPGHLPLSYLEKLRSPPVFTKTHSSPTVISALA